MPEVEDNLPEAIIAEIKRVTAIKGDYEELRGMPNVIVEPTIMLMQHSIDNAIRVSAAGDVVGMIRALADLREYSH